MKVVAGPERYPPLEQRAVIEWLCNRDVGNEIHYAWAATYPTTFCCLSVVNHYSRMLLEHEDHPICHECNVMMKQLMIRRMATGMADVLESVRSGSI